MLTRLDHRQNMALCVELHETGLALMRQKIKRECPAASSAQVDEEWMRWLYRQQEAIPGDVAGSVRIRQGT